MDKYIDLHIHTKYSDGEHTLEEILRQSETSRLSAISITDHDTVDVYKELKQNKNQKLFSGIIIPGIEISSNLDNYLIDILGYDIDIEKMDKLLKEKYNPESNKKMQEKILEEFKNLCSQKQIKYDETLKIKNGTKSEAFNILFLDISNFNKYPENKKFESYISRDNRSIFYKHYFSNPQSDFFVNEAKYYPSVEEAIEMIHKCNGKAFLAHAFAYKLNDYIKLIDYAIEKGIDGIEKYYPTFEEEQINIIERKLEKNNLYASGGSDYHGLSIKKNHQLGLPKISHQVIMPWTSKYYEKN